MKTSIIVAVSENDVIGRDNSIPWKQTADMKRFRQLTSGHPVIMGRRTFESIGKPLPNRTNIVVTRNLNWQADGCISAQSVRRAIEVASEIDQEEVFIIGGYDVYSVGLAYADTVYLTRIEAHVEGDIYFPPVRWEEWNEVSCQRHEADDQNEHPYSFLVYKSA